MQSRKRQNEAKTENRKTKEKFPQKKTQNYRFSILPSNIPGRREGIKTFRSFSRKRPGEQQTFEQGHADASRRENFFGVKLQAMQTKATFLFLRLQQLSLSRIVRDGTN
jgi:hypothetical protein